MSGFIFKQDLAGRYFPGYDKEVSRRLFARELHTNTDLMADLQGKHSINYTSAYIIGLQQPQIR